MCVHQRLLVSDGSKLYAGGVASHGRSNIRLAEVHLHAHTPTHTHTLTLTLSLTHTLSHSQRKCFEGFSDNAFVLPASAAASKIFVVAARDLEAGEEIFYPYLWQYWKPKVTVGEDQALTDGEEQALVP
jgi:SET domain-containing protein